MFADEPTIRNSNLLPVKANGEVRFLSVLSLGIGGNAETPILSSSFALPLYSLPAASASKILSRSEIHSRMEILLENYANIIHIEALTALDIARKQITPAVVAYETFLANGLMSKMNVGGLDVSLEKGVLTELSALSKEFSSLVARLSTDLEEYNTGHKNITKAKYCKNTLLADMEELRGVVDRMELITGKEFHPFPSYEDILYSVKY